MAGKNNRRSHVSRVHNNASMFRAMVIGATLRRHSRSLMAVIASLVGAATLMCLASICLTIPHQIRQELRAYGANVVVTANNAQGLDSRSIDEITDLVLRYGQATQASYRYENVRVHTAPYVVAGIDAGQVQTLNQHWVVEGDWPSDGNVMVGQDVADALGVTVGSSITLGYRASDNADISENTGTTGDEHAPDSTDTTGNTDVATSDESSDGVQMPDGTQSVKSGEMPDGTESADVGDAADTTTTSNTTVSTDSTDDGRISTDILSQDGVELRVSGILETGGGEDAMMYVTKADCETISGLTRGADVVEFSSQASDEDLVSLISNLNASGLNISAQQVSKVTSSDTRIIAMLQALFWIVSIVVLALTSVGVSTTISSMVSQRRCEIGLRKALGASSRSISAEFYVEAALYGCVGGILGSIIGWAAASWLCVTAFSRQLDTYPWLFIVSITVSVTLAVLGCTPPVNKAASIDPARVLREE